MSAVATVAAGPRSGRGALEDAVSPHPLGALLPAIFQPLLDADEVAVLRHRARGLDDASIGERIGRDRAAVGALAASARAKLGLRDATPAAAATLAARDTFADRFCAALDTVLAPVFVTLDSVEAYVDPALTPRDFVAWLGGWVAITSELAWPEDAWRQAIAEAWWLYERRGTADALRRLVELYTGGEVEVDDPGGGAILTSPDDTRVSWPRTPPVVSVRVKGGRVSRADTALLAGLDELVRSAVPAHLPARVEVRAR